MFQSVFRKIGSIKWSSVLDNTGRVLNLANQAIPMVKQITPVVRNAKTMFHVMNEFKKLETNEKISPISETKPMKETNNTSTGPTFFA